MSSKTAASAVAALLNPASEESKTRQFMPFAHTQRATEPIPCDSKLLMYELSTAVFQCGARGFNDLLMMPERIRLVKLFVFLLQVACECNARVSLETVVDEHDHVHSHKKKLDSKSVVVAYRLWIPLDAAQEMAFAYAVSAAVSSVESVTEHLSGRDNSWYKRRRLETFAEAVQLPPYAQAVASTTELTELIRLYFMGKRKIDCVVGSVGEPGETGQEALADLLDAKKQFANEEFIAQGEHAGVWREQLNLDNYIAVSPEGYTPAFKPKGSVASLVRVFQCGPDGSFLRAGADIFKYLLPQFQPTLRQLRTQLENVFAARGAVRSLGHLSMEELVEMSLSNEAALCQDPHAYAPMVVERDCDLSDCSDSFYEAAMMRQYHIMATLHDRNTARRTFAAASKDSTAVQKIYASVERDVVMMLSAPTLKGCPPVYNDLKQTSDSLLDFMHSPPESLHDRMAQHYFKTAPAQIKAYRGFSAMLTRLTVGARNNLGLRDHQNSVWLLLYLRHFAVTFNRMGESFFGVLTGPPDSGKSRACEVFANCIATKLVQQVDGSSALAMTTYGPEHDLRVVLVDELKNVNDKYGGGNDMQTKLIQSQISNGCITYNTKVTDPVKGGFKLQRTVTVLRNATITCTNFVGHMAPALKSRATTFGVPSSQKIQQRGKFVSKNASVATRDRPNVAAKRTTWAKCLQTYSALQYRYTAMEAAGLIPPMDDTLLTIFFFMLFDEFGDTVMSKRRIVSLKQFAVSIRIFDLITAWYTRGLGRECDNNPSSEILFYASGSYLTAESIVAAYALLEQTTSTTAQLNKMMGYLKETILVDDDRPVVEGEYYVSRYNRTDLLLKHLKKFMTGEGDGVVDALWKVIDSSITEGGLPKVKLEKDDTGAAERFYFHRSWMAGFFTEAERCVLKVLRRLYRDKQLCAPEYEHETTKVVFDGAVLLSIYEVENDKHPTQHPELIKKTKSQMRRAVFFLEDMLDSSGERAFEHESWVNTAKYVSTTEGNPAAVESKLQPGKFMVCKEGFNALVVSRDILEPSETSQNVVDDFFVRFLTVAGGYNDGRRVYAGVDAIFDHGHVPDHTIRVPPDKKVTITLANDAYKSDACDYMMMGGSTSDLQDEIAADEDLKLQQEIFPPDKEVITLDETSCIEAKVASRAMERVCLPPDLAAKFIDVRIRL